MSYNTHTHVYACIIYLIPNKICDYCIYIYIYILFILTYYTICYLYLFISVYFYILIYSI